MVMVLPDVKNGHGGVELISLQTKIGFEGVEFGLTLGMRCQ